MSKDSTPTYLHLHAPHHADLFEEFCQPPSRTSDGTTANNPATSSFSTSNAHTAGNVNATNDPSMVHVPGHFLPFEEIVLPPHLMPVNPEDEDGVVPDMHAAFGIQRALAVGQEGVRREAVWQDLGLDRLLQGVGGLRIGGTRKEGKRSGILSVR